MKKSLLAVAAIGAFASAAQAQSSVTVYGILDVGYIGGNTRVQDSAKGNATGYNNGTTKTTVNQFGQGAEQTNRLGFKGVEDLGGGTSAFFTAEFALAPQDQTLSGNKNGGLSNRQTFVGLKKNGIGQTAIGLQYTPIFNAGAVTDPGQYNNMTGNVIYAGSTGISAANAGTNNVGFTNRTANTLSVKSDNFAGFTGSAIYTLNNINSTETSSSILTTGGNLNASGWGLGADFTYHKFYITAAYQAFKQLTVANGDPTATAIWTNAQANGATASNLASAQNVQDNQFYAGTTYDFGILKAYAQYVSRKATSTITTNYYLKRSAEQIGVRSYITPTVEAWASAGLGRYTSFGTNQPTANFNGWQLGSNYYLSKRTNLYAIYGQHLTSTAAAGSTTTGGGTSNYAIGVRHTF
ncbi:porin [Polynucleobacter sp. JS-Safj-400b-B2]|uniref:porin n=1 Tax=Polynucleobacter sp. JS-Safj-400b-B2 TaxID=2576921 RepID=UPI001C0BC3FF|nr:porin [Polynucleobacter sp. JS-Safj-400b-B2]MBU3625249.1 porin [Polynucleobacter sp. JS-Safj-400b-B2]